MRKRRGEITRLETLSDGVFAFAATLLVVSLEVPRTIPELLGDLSQFAGFALSFGALLAIWSIHNAFFRRYSLDDSRTVALNGLLLLVVLFYVYPLKFLSVGLTSSLLPIAEPTFRLQSADELAALFTLYSGGFLGVFLTVSLLYRHAHSVRQQLGLSAYEAAEARHLSRHYLLFALVAIVSVVLAQTGIGLRIAAPGWIYGLLGPLCYAQGAWSERRELGALRPETG